MARQTARVLFIACLLLLVSSDPRAGGLTSVFAESASDTAIRTPAPGSLLWRIIKTEHFEVFYKSGYESKARECLLVLEAYRANVKKQTGKEIQKLRVVIEDIGQVSNAFADPLNPNIHIYTYPPDAVMGGMPGIDYGENWWRMSGLHESIHIGQLTQTGEFPGILSTAFGNYFSPNLIVPGWIAEGVTVLGESQLSPYEGRLNDGFFDTVFQAYTSQKPFPNLLQMTYTPLDFPGIAGGQYLYGGLFMNYLRERYGQDKVNEFFKNQGESFFGWLVGWLFPETGIDYSARKTFGKSFSELRMEWLADYPKQLARQGKPPFAIDGNPLTEDKLAVYSDLVLDKNTLYYIKREFRKADASTLYRFERIIKRELPSGSEPRISVGLPAGEQEIVSTTSFFNARPQVTAGNQLYYSVLELKRGYANSSNSGFGYISNIHKKDLGTGKDEIAFSDEIRTFAVLDDKIIYTKDRVDAFGSEIWLYSPGNKESRLLVKSDYLVSQITNYLPQPSSPGGSKVIISARYDWENFGIYSFDLSTLAFEELVNTPYAETSPWVSDGKVFFVANYNKTYRVYVYDLSTKNVYQATQGSYAHSPVLHNQELYFVGMTAEGTNIYHKPLTLSDVTLPKSEQSQVPNLEGIANQANIQKGGYVDVLKTMAPYFRLPILAASPGAILVGSDITNEHYYQARFTVGSDPTLNLLYENRLFKPLTLGVELSDRDGSNDRALYGRYPLYLQLEPGLSYLATSLAVKKDESSVRTHTEVIPGVQAAVTYPKWRVQSQLNYVVERKSWDNGRRGDQVDRNAVELSTVFSHYTGNIMKDPTTGSEFRLISYLINDPGRLDYAELEIRGYHGDNALKTRRGGTLTAEYALPVYQWRNGWWNPNIYFEDISLVGFTDTAFGEDNRPNLSVGAELRAEAALGLFLRFIPALGIAFTRDGDSETYLAFYFTSSEGSGNNRFKK